MCIPTIRELPYMTDFLKIAKSIVVHFAHICAYGVETVNGLVSPNAGICSSAVNLFNGGLPNFLLRNTELSIQFVTRLNLQS